MPESKAISFIFVLLLALQSKSFSQISDSTYYHLEDTLERLLDQIDDDEMEFSSEEYAQYLMEMLANPINVNNASLDELLRVPGMKPVSAGNIVAHRKEKEFMNLDDLLSIDGIDISNLEKMRSFVSVENKQSQASYANPSYWTQDGRFEVISRYQQVLEQLNGYQSADDSSSSRYVGSPVRYYQRFNYRSNHLALNFTQLKAPGETLENPFTFDFNSGHLAITNIGMLKMLVLGDYGLYFGQGLVVRTGRSFGKGTEVSKFRENERGVRPYQSAGKTQAKKGAAFTYGDKIQTTLFYSTRKLSATVIGGDSIHFPGSTGLHRTQNELNRRNNTTLQTIGGRIRYRYDRGSIGLSGYQAEFSKYIVPGEAVHNLYDFKGVKAGAGGIDYMIIVNNFLFFGEAARSMNGGRGLISGLNYSIGPTILSLTFRNYGKDLQSVFGNGFSESSKLQNEEGVYLAFQHTSGKKVKVSSYFDQYNFKAPRIGMRQPSRGYDWLIKAEYRVLRDMQINLQIRNKKREGEFPVLNDTENEVHAIDYTQRGSIRVQLDYQLNPVLRSRTRVERLRGKSAGEPKEYGTLVYQDFRWKATSRLLVDTRLTVFDTKSFVSRVFQFENDMLYMMTNQALFDGGQRFYILLRYQAVSIWDIWVKYGVTVYEDRMTVGSGLDESMGNTRSNIGIQMRLKF